jgi:hypothetical protein
MDDLDAATEHGETGAPGRRRLLVAIATIAAIALAATLWWLARPVPSRPPAPPPVPQTTPPPAVGSPPAPRAPASPPPAVPAPRRRPRAVPEARPAPALPAAPAPPTRELVVDVDVAGALVFVDRKFLGNAPVRTAEISPGPHQINVSAEGYEGVARSIDVAESGETTITVRLRDVHLNQAVDVVHKHRMGSCRGRLTADLAGLRYAPAEGDDAFVLAFEALDAFDVDYLKKNLRVRQRGGRTWNFESPSRSADPLFVFHREVQKAREKLAAR